MTDDKLAALFRFYKQEIARRLETSPDQYTEKLYDTRLVYPGQMVAHAAWMCDEASAGRMSREKRDRWLGFVQGVLHALGHYSVRELRDQSRGDDPPPTPENSDG